MNLSVETVVILGEVGSVISMLGMPVKLQMADYMRNMVTYELQNDAIILAFRGGFGRTVHARATAGDMQAQIVP